MKNSEIHTGLPQRELRDFFAISTSRIFDTEMSLKKAPSVPYIKGDSFSWGIKDAENEIIFQKNRIEIIKEKQALAQLIKSSGWSEYDVSDETQKDLMYKLHLNFIGTKKEYDAFIKKLKNEK